MSNSAQPSRNERHSEDTPVDIDKEVLYGEYLRSSRWRDDLHRKAAHKALDIGEEEMIDASRRTTIQGIGWKEIAVVGALALGAWGIYTWQQRPPVLPPAATDTDSWIEYSGEKWIPPADAKDETK